MSTPLHIRAAALLCVYATLLLASAPGLDSIGGQGLRQRDRQEAIEEGFPVFLIDAVDLLSQINPRIRAPFLQTITPVLFRPLRISQGWALYGNGPRRVWRVEIAVDGALRYRSGDPGHRWLSGLMEDGRLKPTVADLARDPRSVNTPGFLRLIAARAREAEPGASQVTVRALTGDYPGTDLHTAHGWSLAAPDWSAERLP